MVIHATRSHKVYNNYNNLSLIPLVTLEQLMDNADIALFDIVSKDTLQTFMCDFLVLHMLHGLFFTVQPIYRLTSHSFMVLLVGVAPNDLKSILGLVKCCNS